MKSISFMTYRPRYIAHWPTSSEGKLLAVSHTYQQPEGSAQAKVRIISAREATRRERQQYEDKPR